MSSEEIAISVRGVSKHFAMFQRPEDRLKQMIVPRLQRLAGRAPTRYFNHFAALSNVSFDVERGETVGIVGRNGSGKSTLLQIICGTLQPTAGTVQVNGRVAALLELGAGFNPDFTGRENVYLNAAIRGLTREETDARFDSIAAFADIGPFIEQPVKTYSSGMYVRLAFATAINVDPDILVVDEALSVGDEAFQRKCFARIEDIKDRGGTILFVSHGMQTILQLCDRAVLIDGGDLLLDGRTKSIVTYYQRLCNASGSALSDIRREIESVRNPQPDDDGLGHAIPLVPPLDDMDTPSEHSPTIEPANPEQADQSDIRANYFDPGIVSQSAVSFEERGARICSTQICTMADQPVNVLRMGRRYSFCFEAHFTSDAEDVGFNFMIRSKKGLPLFGAYSKKGAARKGIVVRQGESVALRFEFVCSLVPGLYFATARVIGRTGHEMIIMHKVIDSLAFRVAFEPDNAATGLFDPDVRFHLQRGEKQQDAR